VRRKRKQETGMKEPWEATKWGEVANIKREKRPEGPSFKRSLE
jgi:hypothetical protein